MNTKPVSYLQTDSRWGSWPYSNKDEKTNIARSGCGPTAMAMVIATWKDPSVTPVTTCQWALNKGYKATGNGTYHSYFVPQAAAYGITCERVNTTSLQYMYDSQAAAYHQKAWDAVNEGHIVICLMGPGNWTSGGHYIVWYSNDDSGNVYINDPASTKSTRLKNTFTLLKSQVRYYWICKVPEEVINMLNSEVQAYIKQEVQSAVSSINSKIDSLIPNYIASLNGSTPSSWAKDAWYSAIKEGVVDGSNPLAHMTREQMATILSRIGAFDTVSAPNNVNWEDLNQQLK